MKTTLTAKLKLHTTPEQCAALRATQLAYRDSVKHPRIECGGFSGARPLKAPSEPGLLFMPGL